jgi:hypothetical protein
MHTAAMPLGTANAAPDNGMATVGRNVAEDDRNDFGVGSCVGSFTASPARSAIC